MRDFSRLAALAAPLLLLGCGGSDEATGQADDTPLPAEATKAGDEGLPNPDVEPAPDTESDTPAPRPATPPAATSTTSDDPPPEVVPDGGLPDDATSIEPPPTDSVDEPPPPEETPEEPMA